MITISKSQVTVMNIQYGYYPLEKFLDDAARAGVEHVELWRAAPHFHLEDMAYTDVCRVRKQIEERGLSLEITDGRYRVDPTFSVLQSVERLYDVLI